MARNTSGLKPFKPGQSGNPSGRKPIPPDVREAARAWTKQAIATLGGILTDADAPPGARVSAATTLLDRAWGKPDTTLIHKDARDVRELSEAQLLAIASGERDSREASGEEQPSQLH